MWSASVSWLNTASCHSASCHVCFYGTDYSFQSTPQGRISSFFFFFSPVSVGSIFIVGGMRWGKNPFEILSSSIQPEEGSTWFYKGSVLFQKASLARRASSNIAGTWQPAFVLPSFETWMPYFLQHDGVLLYLVLRGWELNIVLLSEACSLFFLWTSCLTNTSAAFFSCW